MPVVPKLDPGRTSFETLYMPGEHSTPVLPMDGTSAPVELTKWLADPEEAPEDCDQAQALGRAAGRARLGRRDR